MKMIFEGETERAEIFFTQGATQEYIFTKIYTTPPKVLIASTDLEIKTVTPTLTEVRLIGLKKAKSCTIVVVPN